MSEVSNPWRDDLAIRKHGSCVAVSKSPHFFDVEVPRTELLKHLRDHIEGVREMFTCPGEVSTDRDKDIAVSFDLFLPYMQHVCRVLSIRLLLPELSECIARNSQHGRVFHALVSCLFWNNSFREYFLDTGRPRSWCKVRSGDSKNDYICSCSYSLSQAQSVHSVWSNFFLDGLESTSWGPIPQFRRMVEGRVLILRLNFSFSVQNFIELYNRNVKSSRKHDRSQWTRCNGGIPHVPQRYTKKRDAEKCNLKPSAHWIFNLVDSCWPGFPLCVVHNGGSGGVSVWKESTRASFDGIRQCGAMLPRPAVPGHERQNAPHNGIICRINF